MLRLLLIGMALLVPPIVGAVIGTAIGDATCRPDPVPGFLEIPCYDETMRGLVVGLLAGILITALLGLWLLRRGERHTRLLDEQDSASTEATNNSKLSENS